MCVGQCGRGLTGQVASQFTEQRGAEVLNHESPDNSSNDRSGR
jgi:hypothetical protein